MRQNKRFRNVIKGIFHLIPKVPTRKVLIKPIKYEERKRIYKILIEQSKIKFSNYP